MSTNIIRIVSISGKSSQKAIAMLNAIKKSRKVCDDGMSSSDWGKRENEKLNHLIDTIDSIRYELPVIHYSEYIDNGAVAGSTFAHVDFQNHFCNYIMGSTYNVK